MQSNAVQCSLRQCNAVGCNLIKVRSSAVQSFLSGLQQPLALARASSHKSVALDTSYSANHNHKTEANIFQYFDKYTYAWVTRASQSNNMAKGHGIPVKNYVLQAKERSASEVSVCSYSVIALFLFSFFVFSNNVFKSWKLL